MAWEISWSGDTRERLQKYAREFFPGLPIKQDIAEIIVQSIEEEIRLHPQPGADQPQTRGEERFTFGDLEVIYHLDSLAGKAEVREVTRLS
jgi:hypothetical protein